MKKQLTNLTYAIALTLLPFQCKANELTNSDSNSLSPQEAKIFLGVVCDHGEITSTQENGKLLQYCKNITNYPKGNCSTSMGQGLQMESVIYGSFSSTNNKEAIVDYNGCETHGDMYGGSILLKQAMSGWKVSGFLPSFRSRTCLKFSQPNTKDTLVCHSSTYFTGTEVASISTLSVQNGKLSNNNLLLTQNPDSSQICSTGVKAKMSSITQWKKSKTNDKNTLTIEGKYLSEKTPRACSDTSVFSDPKSDKLDAWTTKLDTWITKNAKPYKITFEIANNQIVVSEKDKTIKSMLDQIGKP